MRELIPTWDEVHEISQKIADNGLIYSEDGPDILYLCSVLDVLGAEMFDDVKERDDWIVGILRLNHSIYGWDAPYQAERHELSVLGMFVQLWRRFPAMAKKTWNK